MEEVNGILNGVEKAVQKLQKQADSLQTAAQETAYALAQHSCMRAVHLAPVRTGALRASIQQEENRVVTRCPYALQVERGTLHSPARPFLSPAVDEMLFRRTAEQKGREAVT